MASTGSTQLNPALHAQRYFKLPFTSKSESTKNPTCELFKIPIPNSGKFKFLQTSKIKIPSTNYIPQSEMSKTLF